MKVRSVVLFSILSSACQNHQAQTSFDYASNLGIAVDKQDRVCLDISNAGLRQNQRIRFVNSGMPQTVGEAEIIAKTDQACTSLDRNTPGLHHYRFKVVQGSLEKSAPAFVLANFGGALTESATGASADLDGDGQTEFFRSCTSSEGVHLTVWSGKPLQGRRKWHYYYYLGFDVEPSCKEADTNSEAK
jgi:hypothetical protein